MPDRLVVSNTSPLLYLHQVNQLDLLRKLYGRIQIPPAVEEELRTGAERGIAVPDVQVLEWVDVQPLSDTTLLPVVTDLGPGEAEAIALALSSPGSLLILDDKLGRRIARLNGVPITGTLGVLVKARREALLPSISPVIEALRRTTMHLAQELIETALRESGESQS
jgi:predicted nucleic acid-binding protein